MLRTISLWAALVVAVALPLSAAGYYNVTQAGLDETISPLEGGVSAEDFYDYKDDVGRSKNDLVEKHVSYLFLYRAPNGQMYLFIIHGQSDESVLAELRIANVPLGAEWLLKDDPPDIWPNHLYDLEGERARWRWGGFWMFNRTAGGVLGPLGEEFEILVTPEQFPGTQDLYFLSGDASEPERISLNRRDTIAIIGATEEIRIGPEARLDIQPVEPRVREEVVFSAAQSTADRDLRLVEFLWNFGDGMSMPTTEPAVRHSYTEAGTYEVLLTVVDSAGNSDTTSRLLHVETVGVAVERSISTEEATPGSTFRVSVKIRADQDLSGAGLEESAPVGWEIQPVESAGAVYKAHATQWVFLDTIHGGTERVVTYDVIVPRPEELKVLRLPESISIAGIFQAKSPDFEMEVGGESRVRITDCLSVDVAIAHLVPAKQPGQQDLIDLTLSEVVTPEQLTRAGELWRRDQAVAGTCGERVTLSKLKELTAHAEYCVPVDRPLPELGNPDLRATRTIIPPVPCAGVVLGIYNAQGEPVGNTFTVKVEITPDVDVAGVGLDEFLPAGWRVTPVQNDGFMYKPGGVQWVYLGTLRGGQTKTIVYEVTVPPTTTIEAPPDNDCNALAAKTVVGRVDSGWPCTEVEVTGDTRVVLSDCLDVEVVISRWDVHEDRINLLLSDRITFEQVQRATAFWLEGERVPHSCPPGIVDYETLKKLIAMWQTGTPLCKELPEATPGTCD